MANPGYVRSTDGSNADNGSTWTLANQTLAGAMADQVAGDTIYVSQAHAESTAGAVTITMPGTLASPNKIIGANDAAEPPTAVSTAPTVTTTGTNAITIAGHGYLYGLDFTQGSGSSSNLNFVIAATAGNRQRYESCKFRMATTGNSSFFAIGSSGTAAPSAVDFENCDFRFSATGQTMDFLNGQFRIRGGSILSGGTAPTTGLFTIGFNSNGRGCTLDVDGFNMVNLGTSSNLVRAVTGGGKVVIRNCKLPASWAGNLSSATPVVGFRAEMWNCDSGDTNYRLWVEDYAGSIKHETTVVKGSGASDGTTAQAWKMVTSSDAEYPTHVLRSPELAIWNATTGSSKTVTVEILHDSTTALKDDEVWLEVQYLGDGSFPITTFIDDCKADFLATAADQTSSSVSWTTTGITNVNKQKLVVSFTPQEKGWFLGTVCLAKASYTVYVNPQLDVT